MSWCCGSQLTASGRPVRAELLAMTLAWLTITPLGSLVDPDVYCRKSTGPGVSATGRKVDFALVGVIGFQGGKVASEHLYWHQATALYQLGILDHPVAAAGLGGATQLLKLSQSVAK